MWAAFKRLPKSNKNTFLLLFMLGFVLYANTLNNKMFWDDQDNILFNEYVHNWKYFSRYFTENNVAGRGLISNYWHPLPLTIWSLEWHLWQDWAPGYHFLQMLLHISAAFLLSILLNKLFNNRLLSNLVSILFLVHPLQTEAITYVSGISDPISAVLLFTSLIFYIKWRKTKTPSLQSWTYRLSITCYLLVFFARETAIFAVGAFALVEFVLQQKGKDFSWKKLSLDLILKLWPYALCALFYVLLRAGPLNFQNTFNLYNETNEYTDSFATRIFTFFKVLTIYSRLLFWPFNLHMERSVELATSFWHPDVLLGAFIFFTSILTAIFFSLKKRFPFYVFLFAIFWFWIFLFPTSNILVPINNLLHEHWLYLPMIGVWLIIVWLGLRLAHKNKTLKVLLVACCVLLVTFFGIRTIQQNRIWRDPITFYNYTLRFAPTSYRLTNNLGMAYAEGGDHADAVRVYKKAISIDPDSAVAYHNLGNTEKALGNKQLAIDNFEKAISLQPKFYFSYAALAKIYYEESNKEKLEEIVKRWNEKSNNTYSDF